LLYHRVADLRSDPQLLCVSREHFREHLEILRRHFRPTSLEQVGQTRVKKRNVIVTFDDGYADNLHVAKPLLERYDTPATVFVSTGYIGLRREFWKDYLERIFLQPGTLPTTLELPVGRRVFRWKLREAMHYTARDYEMYVRWNVTTGTYPTGRQHLYASLCGVLAPLSHSERCSVIDQLLSWAGIGSAARPTHCTLSPEEVFALAEGGLIEVGAHTVSHPVLSALLISEQRNEIEQSKLRLEEILGRQVTSFAYPYGGRSHYTSDTIAAVRAAGFERACANFPGAVRRACDKWQLPRFLVRNWPGEEFARHLREWLSE
jgi:peptidoglycan/xylan/chitin deacetylase (PgdA/CDA1 family)